MGLWISLGIITHMKCTSILSKRETHDNLVMGLVGGLIVAKQNISYVDSVKFTCIPVTDCMVDLCGTFSS